MERKAGRGRKASPYIGEELKSLLDQLGPGRSHSVEVYDLDMARNVPQLLLDDVHAVVRVVVVHADDPVVCNQQ